MTVFSRKYLIIVAITLVVGAVVSIVGNRNSPAYEEAASILTSVITGFTGMAIGTLLFLAARRLIGREWGRLVSCLVSIILSIVAGVVVGFAVVCPLWDSIVFGPHPKAYGGDIVYQFLVLYSLVWTTAVGWAFGMGPGLPMTSQKEGDSSA